MIVGRGLLATAFAGFKSDPAVTIFASGVSNSQETSEAQFTRERELLIAALRGDARLVYFSSCGVAGDPDELTAYMRHKLAMEALVTARTDNMVVRLPQVVGRTGNPHTLTNFLRDRILSGVPFTIWARAERNLIDIDDITAIASHLLSLAPDTILPVTAIAADRSLPMPELVSVFERVLGVPAHCILEQKGSPMRIHPRLPTHHAAGLGIDLGDGYAERVLWKYYGADRTGS